MSGKNIPTMKAEKDDSKKEWHEVDEKIVCFSKDLSRKKHNKSWHETC
jgi:hypothetical protein